MKKMKKWKILFLIHSCWVLTRNINTFNTVLTTEAYSGGGGYEGSSPPAQIPKYAPVTHLLKKRFFKKYKKYKFIFYIKMNNKSLVNCAIFVKLLKG